MGDTKEVPCYHKPNFGTQHTEIGLNIIYYKVYTLQLIISG
jgi:hypothetical protein